MTNTARREIFIDEKQTWPPRGGRGEGEGEICSRTSFFGVLAKILLKNQAYYTVKGGLRVPLDGPENKQTTLAFGALERKT